MTGTKSRVGFYDGLNKEDPFVFTVGEFDGLVAQAESMNYGMHRLLSACVREIRRSPKRQRMSMHGSSHSGGPVLDDQSQELADGIQALLEEGLY